MQLVQRPQVMNVTSLATTGTVTLTGAAGKRVRIWELTFAPAASQTLNIKDGTTSLTGDMTLTGWEKGNGANRHFLESSVGASMNLVLGGTGAGFVLWSLGDALGR